MNFMQGPSLGHGTSVSAKGSCSSRSIGKHQVDKGEYMYVLMTSNDIHNNAGGPSKSSSSVMKKPNMSPLDAIGQRVFLRWSGCVLGGDKNHIKSFKLHLLQDQRELLTEDP